MSVQETADMIDRDAWNRQVTFCGGEPMLQTVALLQLAKELKERDCHFHIVMYTAYNFNKLLKHGLYFHWREKHGEAMKIALRHYSQEYDGDLYLIASSSVFKELIHYIDLIVDGDYQQDKRMTIAPTMHKGGFIGSSNQRVIDCPQSVQTGNFTYSYADKYMDWYSHQNHCKACGHVIPNNQRFCDSRCDDNYQHRLIFLSKHGLQKRFKSFLK
jgi:organic radical activating enzyme